MTQRNGTIYGEVAGEEGGREGLIVKITRVKI